VVRWASTLRATHEMLQFPRPDVRPTALPSRHHDSSQCLIVHAFGSTPCLSLATPGRTAVWACTCRNTISTLADRETPASFADSRYLLVLHLHQRACSPAAPLRHRLLVRGEVEGEEEEQVRRDDADAGNGGEFLAGAFAHVGQARPVRASKVGVGREVDAAWKLLVLDVKCVIAGTYRGR
jgi:hypothetical protein